MQASTCRSSGTVAGRRRSCRPGSPTGTWPSTCRPRPGPGEAVAEVLRAAEALELDYEPLARLLLRSEGVASSYIEGITAPVLDVVLAEDGRAHPAADAAAWVAAALAAMVAAVDEALDGRRRARRRHPLPLAPTPDDRKPDAGALRRSHPRRAGLDRGHQPVRRPPGHPARRPPRAAPRRPPRLGQPGRPRPRRAGRDRARAVRDHPSLRRRQRSDRTRARSRGSSCAACPCSSRRRSAWRSRPTSADTAPGSSASAATTTSAGCAGSPTR